MATPPGFYNPVDQAIYSAGDFFIPQERFRAAPYNVNTPAADDPAAAGIAAVYRPQGGGGGGRALQAGDINYDSFAKAGFDAYANKQPTPLVDDLYQSKVDKSFMGFPSYRQIDQIGPFTPYNKPMDMDDPGASIENIIASRNVPLELTRAGRIQESLGNVKEGIGSFADTVGGFGPVSFFLNKMDRMNTLPELDQQFIKQNMGYTGPTVFGENTGGGYVDPFGVNVRSAFGNYAEKVRSDFEKLSETLGTGGKISEKYGVSYDPVTGEFTGRPEDIEKFKQMNKMNLAKLNFRYKQIQQQEFDKKIAAQKEKARLEEIERIKNLGHGGYDPNVHGPTDYGKGSDGQQSYDFGTGFGTSATSGGPVSNRTGRGRQDYMDGGLADLVDIYD